ncbi:hypothetical protein L2E82_27938 [Cichorium intybus]|uniref:Uncharacterized protein n=1 Tax=Cichorium intybus TaxID=13427 RepID=A0ACB9CV03_CICIN|nr:hypothetical protein L2E82_27938 [Cichorium intybus]
MTPPFSFPLHPNVVFKLCKSSQLLQPNGQSPIAFSIYDFTKDFRERNTHTERDERLLIQKETNDWVKRQTSDSKRDRAGDCIGRKRPAVRAQISEEFCDEKSEAAQSQLGAAPSSTFLSLSSHPPCTHTLDITGRSSGGAGGGEFELTVGSDGLDTLGSGNEGKGNYNSDGGE